MIVPIEFTIIVLKKKKVYIENTLIVSIFSAIGFTILDISKTLMTDFWYLVLKRYYDNAIRCLYSDTDSFIIRVR